MGLVCLLGAALWAGLLVIGLWWVRRGRPVAFGLRGMLILQTLVALSLGLFGWWRVTYLAQTRWLDPASPEAVALFPESQVELNADGEWGCAYASRCVSISALDSKLEAKGIEIQGGYSFHWDGPTNRVEFSGGNRESVEAYLAALKAADIVQPGKIVIRGQVVDHQGNPVANAIVDLQGPYVYINHFKTRDDGTFVMPITPHKGWGYHLRIRPPGGEPMNTDRFSLRYDEPERVVIVRIR